MLLYRYDPQQLRNKLLELVRNNKPHKHYDHTVEYAKFWEAAYTGENQEEFLLMYRPKEKENQQKQRIRLNNTRTQYICHKAHNSLAQLNTVDPAIMSIGYENDNKNEIGLKDIQDRNNIFYNGKPLSKYAFERITYLNIVDPNAFVVIEQETINDELKAVAFPIEIYSDEAWQYEKKNGVLQYLISRVTEKVEVATSKDGAKQILRKEYENAKKIKDPEYQHKKYEIGTVDRRIYTMYAPNVIYRLREIFSQSEVEDGTDVIQLYIDGKEATFVLQTFDTNNPHNPAFCVGYLPNPINKGETYASIYHGGEKLVKQLMWEVSELNLAKALHGFIQKLVYAPTCRNIRTIDNIKEHCNGGTYHISGDTCNACKGTGKLVHETVQDIVVVRMPETKNEETVPLSQMVHYVEIPVHILDAQKESIKDAERDFYMAVLNFDLSSKEDVKFQETATGKILDMRGMYAVLGLLGSQVSEFFKHAVHNQAGYLGIQEGLIVQHQYPLDLRLDTLYDKIEQRKMALDAGISGEILAKIDEEIMSLQCNGHHDTVMKYRAWSRWKPFSDKPVSERLSILAAIDDDAPLKILYTFFDRIMAEIQEDLRDSSTPFYKMDYSQQKQLIDAKVQQYKDDYYPENEEENVNPFRNNAQGSE